MTFRLHAFCSFVLVLAACFVAPAAGRERQKKQEGQRAGARVPLGKSCSLDYVGAFVADGSFRGRTRLRLNEFVDTIAGEPPEHGGPAPQRPLPADLAPPKQRIVQDYEPGAHPKKAVKSRPLLADVVEAIAGLIAEHQPVLFAPSAVTTDSSERVVIADPPAHAVHVLDRRGKTSFRIQGGADRRLHLPAEVAVDSHDNIYVTDAQRGMVLVYDHFGRFRRYIGEARGEGFFERPDGIAIDGRSGRIYVADTPRNAIFIFDFDGAMRGRLSPRDAAISQQPEFAAPTTLVVNGDNLFVLDSGGSRLHVINLPGKLPPRNTILSHPPPEADGRAGLAIDSSGNVYLSDQERGVVRVYNRDSRLLTVMGRTGGKIGEFRRPAGVWADRRDRIYVADSANRRIQVFQLRAGRRPGACQD